MPELSHNRRLLVLGICTLSMLMVGMDITIVNVALPDLHRDLHTSLSDLQWVFDAYTLVLASLLLLAGSTADRLGRRRTFQTGLGVFVLGSLLCSVAPTLAWLVAFRVVQAIGGSMMNPVAMSIITNVFTERRERAFAIGVYGGVAGLSIGIGPLIGGALVEAVGWRGIFWVNIPIGIAAIVLTALFVPESRAPRPRRPDPVGQILVITTLTPLIYAIIAAPRHGWTSASSLGLFAVSLLAVVSLVGYELRRHEPLLDPRFFRSVPFAGATVTAVSALGGYAGFLFLNTLYLQNVRGDSPFIAGLSALPIGLGALLLAPISGRLVGTVGPRVPLVLAGLCQVAGAAMLLDVTADTSIWQLLGAYCVYGVGFGLVNAPITNSAVSGMPTAQAGVAAAVATTSRQVGTTLGIAVVGSVLNSALAGRSVERGFIGADAAAWWIVLGCGISVLVFGIVTTGPWARQTTQRVTQLFDESESMVAV